MLRLLLGYTSTERSLVKVSKDGEPALFLGLSGTWRALAVTFCCHTQKVFSCRVPVYKLQVALVWRCGQGCSVPVILPYFLGYHLEIFGFACCQIKRNHQL